jgi:hypothetical protein
MIVCLNFSSDKTRQNLHFHTWILNRKLYEQWLEKMFSPRALSISFLDERGGVVVEDSVQLWQGTLLAPASYDPGARQGLMGPKAVRLRVLESPLAYWGMSNDSSNARVLWITPDFLAKGDVSLAGNWVHLSPMLENLLIHHEVSLDPDDIKKMNAVRFTIIPGRSEY